MMDIAFVLMRGTLFQDARDDAGLLAVIQIAIVRQIDRLIRERLIRCRCESDKLDVVAVEEGGFRRDFIYCEQLADC